MYVEKIEADRVLRSTSEYCRSSCDPDLPEDPQEDNSRTAKLAKKISDFIRVLRPRVLVSADAEVFEHPIFTDLQGRFSQSEADAALDTLCSKPKRAPTSVRRRRRSRRPRRR